MVSDSVQKRIDEVLAKRDAGIPKEWRLPEGTKIPSNATELTKSSGILNKEELDIIALKAIELRDAIAKGKYTAVAATTAYCKAAAIAQQATNCLIELFADEAIAAAKKLDDEFKKTGKVTGAMHGVPVSIKDHINVKNHDSPSGFLSLVDKMIAKEDAHPVKILRDAGAVFYCSTSMWLSEADRQRRPTARASCTSRRLATTVSPSTRGTTSSRLAARPAARLLSSRCAARPSVWALTSVALSAP